MTIDITLKEKHYIDTKLRLALATFRMYGKIRQGVIERPLSYSVSTLKSGDEYRYHFIYKMYIEYWKTTNSLHTYRFKSIYLHDIGYPLDHLWEYIQSAKHVDRQLKMVSHITHQAAQKAFPNQT